MKKTTFVARVVALSLAACAIVFGGCGDGTAIVGGSCRAPWVECSGACVDVASDPAHCGGCDLACAAGVLCISGRCGGASNEAATTDGAPDATVEGARAVDGGDASTQSDGSDGSDASVLPGDGAADSNLDGASGDACTPPYVSDDQCGNCFTKCVGTNDSCKVGDAGAYACAPFCAPPLSRCGNVCKDLRSDGDNCGICNRVCASNICINSVCQGASSGDIVYIGHDYFATPSKTSQARILENAVLLSPTTPVRVLAYQRYASANAVTKVSAILADAQARSGRTIQTTGTSTDGALIGVTKATYDVVLVYDQLSAPAGSMGTLGAAAKPALGAFTHIGGVVIMLDGATGANPQMHQFSTATGLLTVAQHQSVGAGQQLEIIAPTDALATGVVSPFAMRVATARFIAEPNGGPVSWVARHVTTAHAMVVHKIAP